MREYFLNEVNSRLCSGEERQKWCAFLCNFGAQNRPKKMLYIEIRELKAQLSQARKEAELEKLRAKAYDTMINVAEETFNIPIRKKSGTKR